MENEQKMFTQLQPTSERMIRKNVDNNNINDECGGGDDKKYHLNQT